MCVCVCVHTHTLTSKVCLQPHGHVTERTGRQFLRAWFSSADSTTRCFGLQQDVPATKVGHILLAIRGHSVRAVHHTNGEVVCIHLLVAVLRDLHVAFRVRLIWVNPAAGFANNSLLVLDTQPQLLGIELRELVDCTRCRQYLRVGALARAACGRLVA